MLWLIHKATNKTSTSPSLSKSYGAITETLLLVVVGMLLLLFKILFRIQAVL
jgi:hypothetical protein